MNQYKEALEAKNLQEHLRLTRSNIQVVNDDLNFKIMERDNVIREVETLRKESNEIIRLDSEIIEKTNRSIEKSLKLKKEAEDKIEVSEKRLSEVQTTCDDLIKDSYKQVSVLESKSFDLKNDISNESVNLNKIIEDIKYKKNELNDISNEVKKASKDLISLQEKFNQLETLKASEEQRLAKYTEEVTSTVNDIAQQLLNESEKVKIPRQQLSFELDQFERKMKNFLILKNRFETRFKNAFPGQEVKL